MGKIRVVIAEDHAIVRQGLRLLVQEAQDMIVVGEARNGREAVELTKKSGADVVLMDLVMPFMSGTEAARQLARHKPSPRVLVLSSYSGDECVSEALAAGAAGYLTKHSASTELLQAIREVHHGGSYFSSSIARTLRNNLQRARLSAAHVPPQARLSPREKQVLSLLAQGMPNKEIAYTLKISIKTVEKHRQQLIDKLDIHDTAGLTRYAVEHGFVQAPVVTAGTNVAQKLIAKAMP